MGRTDWKRKTKDEGKKPNTRNLMEINESGGEVSRQPETEKKRGKIQNE